MMYRELNADDYERLMELHESVQDDRGASAHQLTRLVEHTLKSPLASDDKDCCICLMPIDTGQKVKRLPCTHVFHSDCIDSWLKVNATCPVDKTNVF